VPEDRRLTAAEYRLYVEGYDMAVQMAFKVMDLAVARWKTTRRVKRDLNQKRSA
jgi:hypothetical protein